MSRVAGYVLVDGMRVGARMEGLPLTLVAIERFRARSATAEQPEAWTAVEFAFDDGEAERVAAALADVLEPHGGWYSNFRVGGETFVVFAGRVFRYASGDAAARGEVEAYARTVGVPEAQLDWGD